jgi:hypothetical protein
LGNRFPVLEDKTEERLEKEENKDDDKGDIIAQK